MDLTPLLVRKRFTFREYLHSLKTLFPKGWIWNWPLAYEDILMTDGIASAEVFGWPTIIFGQQILPQGIVSAQAFGTASLGRYLLPSGIASAGAFGSLTISNNYGFYLYDDFETSSIKTEWNSAFYNAPSNWTVKTQEGQEIAYSPNHSVSALFPQSTTKISGNFEIKWQFVLGTNSGGNTSLHIQVKDPSDGHLHGNLFFVPDTLKFEDNGAAQGEQTGFTPPKVVTCKIVRSSGVIWAYYNNDAAGGEAGSWIRNDAWSTPGSSISFSSDCVIEIDGDDGYGGFGFIEVKGDSLV